MRHSCALAASFLLLALGARATASFSVVVDVKPMRAEDDRSGFTRQALALVPVYLAETDDVELGEQGFCNLHASMLTSGGPRIVAQQWDALQVYHRHDPARRRAMLAHGALVLDRVEGQSNQTFQILVENAANSADSLPGLARVEGRRVVIDTGAARFTLAASDAEGFRLASALVNGHEVLHDHGENGTLFMYRRNLAQGGAVDTLRSSLGTASAAIKKNGSACTEVVVHGEMKPASDPTGLGQRYVLLLRFHRNSTRVAGELLLTNWSYSHDGAPANYIIPYDGFGMTLRLAHGAGQHAFASLARDGDQLADCELAQSGDSASVLLGYKQPRQSGEYEGLSERNYWPENARRDADAGGLDLVTKGMWLLLNGRLDPRYVARCGDPTIYPTACAARVRAGASEIAAMSGSFPEYAQPVGLTITQQPESTRIEVALTDYRAPNALGKSIPWRSCVRKAFALDFGFSADQDLFEFVRSEQVPYIGIYANVADYDGRCRSFAFLADQDRNALWQETGFLEPGDAYYYGNPARKDLRYPFWIGANRTGGDNNWDQQFIDFLLGLHGKTGNLLALRWNINFHTQLGVRQFDDAMFDAQPLNPDQRVTTNWEIDIEHEDHKGYHLGTAFFANPLDIECLAHQAYFTLGMPDVGAILYIRAIGNRIGRIAEEQGFLRSLFCPEIIGGGHDTIEDAILERGVSYYEDFDARRIDPADPCGGGGWTMAPTILPAFRGDPEDIDFPVANAGTPARYPWVSKAGAFKVIDAFHLVKGLSSVREFMLSAADYPAPYRARIAALELSARLRLAQGGITIAQWYAFLFPFCANFDPACTSFAHLPPWERIRRQKKHYPSCMSICDDRIMDEDNNWMAYSFTDAYAEAAEQYVALGDVRSAFYMLRYGLNHLSTVRFGDLAGDACGPPADKKQNDFFWSSIYPGEMRLWKDLRDWGWDAKFAASYPNLFPVENRWP
ncbi:MAG: hypothetical protein U1E76_14085 [Planctomycetota bacterium]